MNDLIENLQDELINLQKLKKYYKEDLENNSYNGINKSDYYYIQGKIDIIQDILDGEYN